MKCIKKRQTFWVCLFFAHRTYFLIIRGVIGQTGKRVGQGKNIVGGLNFLWKSMGIFYIIY